MLELYSTPLDVLYLVLTIVIAALGLFLVIALYHLIKILSNINKVSAKAKDTIDLINHYLWQPIKIAMMIIEKSKTATKKASRKST
ncbi:MAG: hypothetical protein OEY44_01000 [Candidatus Peregrinibacteria bacterium]|nr:hypothetical protein [Candidatus Peregrinibacteria bacterium]